LHCCTNCGHWNDTNKIKQQLANPAGGKLTSWLSTSMEELHLGPPNTNPSSGREEDFNLGHPDDKSSTLKSLDQAASTVNILRFYLIIIRTSITCVISLCCESFSVQSWRHFLTSISSPTVNNTATLTVKEEGSQLQGELLHSNVYTMQLQDFLAPIFLTEIISAQWHICKSEFSKGGGGGEMALKKSHSDICSLGHTH